LGNLAERLWDAGKHKAARRTYSEAFQHHAHAVQIKPDSSNALNNWAVSLLTLGRQQRDNRLVEEAREKAWEAETIKPGQGAYNLACAEALPGNEATALEWLEKALGQKKAMLSWRGPIRTCNRCGTIRDSGS